MEQPLRRNRPFVLFTAGQMTSEAGSFLLMLAVLLQVYGATHSTRVTTVAFLAEQAPALVLSSYAGVVADRSDRRLILIVSDAVRALLLVPLLVTSSTGAVIAVVAGLSAVGAVFRPTARAFVPSLVPPAKLTSANGVTSSTEALLSLACPAIGAALFAAFGFSSVVAVDVATFAVSIATLLLVRPAYGVPAQRSAGTSIRSELVAGIRLLAGTPTFRLLLTTGLFLGLFQACITPLIVPFFEGVLHASAAEVGLVVTAQGIGTLVTGLVVSARGERYRASRMFVIGGWGLGLLGVVLALSPSYAFALVLVLLLGVPQVLFQVGEMTLLQTAVPQQLLGRAMGIFEAAIAVATVAGAAVPAFLTGALGVRGVVLTGALTGTGAAVVATLGYGRIVSTETVTSSSTSGITSGPTPGPEGTLMCPSSSTNGGVTSRA
jgi:MFS family permease